MKCIDESCMFCKNNKCTNIKNITLLPNNDIEVTKSNPFTGTICKKLILELGKIIGAREAFKELKIKMKDRDDDCADPPNAVDKGYSLAVSHMSEEIENILKDKEEIIFGGESWL